MTKRASDGNGFVVYSKAKKPRWTASAPTTADGEGPGPLTRLTPELRQMLYSSILQEPRGVRYLSRLARTCKVFAAELSGQAQGYNPAGRIWIPAKWREQVMKMGKTGSKNRAAQALGQIFTKYLHPAGFFDKITGLGETVTWEACEVMKEISFRLARLPHARADEVELDLVFDCDIVPLAPWSIRPPPSAETIVNFVGRAVTRGEELAAIKKSKRAVPQEMRDEVIGVRQKIGAVKQRLDFALEGIQSHLTSQYNAVMSSKSIHRPDWGWLTETLDELNTDATEFIALCDTKIALRREMDEMARKKLEELRGAK